MMQTQPFEKHVWAEIDLEALRHNFRAVKARAGALPLCAVVKADSYGHGAVQCARVFAEEGAAWLAVSCLTEAVQLRKGGLTLPILVLGHVQPGYAAALIQNHITVACYSAAQAKALSDAAVAAGGRVQIHLKADTGMGRIGFALRTDFDAAHGRDMLDRLCACPGSGDDRPVPALLPWPTTTAPTASPTPAEQHAPLRPGLSRASPAAGFEPASSSTATTPPG